MLAAPAVHALTPFVLQDIRIEGLQRTDPGTVFAALPLRIGDTYTDDKGAAALRALFATGLFKDVRIEVEGQVATVIVDERAIIATVSFVGLKEFDKDTLLKSLKDNGIGEGLPFDKALIDRAEQEIKRQYLSHGYYAAAVQTTVTPLERNRVGINITVTEGEVAKIGGISIVGAQAFPERELVDLFVLRTPGWLTWYTKHDRYAREKLSADLETLRSHYQNRGYLDFNIESTQVSITPDRRQIYITVNIIEGEKYTVSDVQLSGQMLLPRDQLEKLVQLKPGDVFSREKLAASTKAISDRLGNEGYAFANTNAIPNVDKEKRSVAFNIVIDPGRRVYVRRIDVAGNTKTRDEVIRREMRQLEGAYYDASKIQLSRRRIERTGYFTEATVETRPVETSNDQVDVLYSVKERPTGALLVGVGFSSVEKLAFSTSIQQSNAFGTGKFIAATINSGSVNKVYSLSYLDPYYTIDGVSQGFDVYKRRTDASQLTVAPYVTDSIGGGVKFGYPTSEITAIDFGVNFESVNLQTFDTSPLQYINFVSQFGNTYRYAAATAGWTRDTRDNILQPKSGALSRVSSEFASGDLQYYRVGFQQQWLHPLTSDYTLFLRGDLGYAAGLGAKPLPFFKAYFLGGPDSVRGYSGFSLGPQDINGNAVGGNRRVNGTAEFQFPMPGATREQSLRLGLFLDAGQVYAQGQKLALGDLRYSTGLGLQWISPFGPLRFSIAQPLRSRPEDHIQRIQFTFGTGF